jgi:hypothetical protein
VGWADRTRAHQQEGGSPVNGYRKPRRKEIRRKSHYDLRKIGSTHIETPNNPLGMSLGAGPAVNVRGQFEQVHVRR